MQLHIESAIAAHLAWTERFAEAIRGQKMSPAVRHAGYDDLCDFGKWLYARDDPVKHTPEYRRVKDLHYRFHLEAAAIVRLMELSFFDDAKSHLAGDYAQASAALLAALHAWLAAVDAGASGG